MYALFSAIPYVGHMNPLLRQAAELERRGWRTVFAGFSELRAHAAAEAPAVTYLDIGALGPTADKLRRTTQEASRDPNFLRGALRITLGLAAVWPAIFDGVARTVAGDRPDVIVTDLFTSAAIAAADAAGVPAVVNNPDLLAALPIDMLAPADHLPPLFSGLSIHEISGFRKRILTPVGRKFVLAAATRMAERKLNAQLRTRGLPATTIRRFLGNKTILVNGAFGLEYARPLPPQVSMVGPMLPENPSPLPKELEAWLGDGPPVVYVNLGTLVDAPSGQIEKMAAALRSDRFRSLWILSAKQSEHLPKPLPGGLRLMEWGPAPLAVLSHPNVKVFLSHCGINSVYESMAAGTPIVGIPMFADQRDMAVRVADAGVGLWLNKTTFTAKSLTAALERVLQETVFTSRIAAIQEAIRDTGSVRRAADLIEKAASGNQWRPA